MKDRAAGIDIGATTVKLGIFDRRGTLIEKWTVPSRKGGNGSVLMDDIAQTIREHLPGESPEEALAGIGAGVPGPGVFSSGQVPTKFVNLGIRDLNPAEELGARLGQIPVFCANDANAAALGEAVFGSGRGYRSLFFITLGTGVGGGFIREGRILEGSHGYAGEIGHFCINPEETEACSCGGHGCLEQYSSATGISRLMEQKTGSRMGVREIFSAAAEGDPAAGEVLDRAGFLLAQTMAAVTFLLDPEVILVGGGVSAAGEALMTRIRKPFERLTPFAERKPVLALASLGGDAGLYGAAALALANTGGMVYDYR